MKKIFEPIEINKVMIKNRLVVPAMVTNYANTDGSPSERLMAYYEEKAKGGWGLIILEDVPINPYAGAFKHLPGFYTDELVAEYKTFTDRIHVHGAKIIAQIYHAGFKAIPNLQKKGLVSASIPIGENYPGNVTPLSKNEIEKIKEEFMMCAIAAKKAGFDGVEIHGAHGYLLNQFSSPLINKRTDEYGGTIAGRIRLSCEIVQKIREAVGKDFLISYRMSSVEYEIGGQSLEESKAMAILLEKAGIDVLNVSQGAFQNWVVIPPSVVPRANYVNNAAEIKKVVNIPIMATGRINDPLLAEEILLSEKADLCIMGRASIADPYLPNKAQHDNIEDILHCIGCNQGCIGQNRIGNSVRCMVNPLTGRESEYDLSPASQKKNIYIAGGGVAGCEAAIVAALKGHTVTIYEKENCVGGQWLAAAMPPGKAEFSSFVSWQKRMLKNLGVKVILNQELTKEIVLQDKPDGVIIASGSTAFVPPIDGIDDEIVYQANEVLLGKKQLGHNVAVIGGGLVGVETALQLAVNGSKVSIIEMQDKILKDGEPQPNHYLFEHLKQYDVKIFKSAKVIKIKNNTLSFERCKQEFVLENLDHIILAAGSKSHNILAEELLEKYTGTVIVVGDAKKTKNGYLNIQEAFEKGLQI